MKSKHQTKLYILLSFTPWSTTLKGYNSLKSLASPPPFHSIYADILKILYLFFELRQCRSHEWWAMLPHDFCIASSVLVFNFCCHGNCPAQHQLAMIACRQSDNKSKKSDIVSITINQYLLNSSSLSWAPLEAPHWNLPPACARLTSDTRGRTGEGKPLEHNRELRLSILPC